MFVQVEYQGSLSKREGEEVKVELVFEMDGHII